MSQAPTSTKPIALRTVVRSNPPGKPKCFPVRSACLWLASLLGLIKIGEEISVALDSALLGLIGADLVLIFAVSTYASIASGSRWGRH